MWNDTLLVLTTDNGGPAYWTSEYIQAGLDEGLPSFCLRILVYMEIPSRKLNGSDE